MPNYRGVFLKTFAGYRPPRYGMGDARATVGRGPVPRHAPVSPKTFAGDKPPRYGIGRCPCHRRARACPSPRPGLPKKRSRGTGPRATVGATKNVRGGQAPALRYREILASRRARAWFMFGMGRCRTTEESFLTVGRGPVPRHAPVSLKTFAGDRPPRYVPARGTSLSLRSYDIFWTFAKHSGIMI